MKASPRVDESFLALAKIDQRSAAADIECPVLMMSGSAGSILSFDGVAASCARDREARPRCWRAHKKGSSFVNNMRLLAEVSTASSFRSWLVDEPLGRLQQVDEAQVVVRTLEPPPQRLGVTQ